MGPRQGGGGAASDSAGGARAKAGRAGGARRGGRSANPAACSPQGSKQLQEKSLKISSTLYVGNLSFYTTEEQIQELFSKCGDVKRIVMGLDKIKKTPCGFCFVEYPFRFPVTASPCAAATFSSSAQQAQLYCCGKPDKE